MANKIVDVTLRLKDQISAPFKQVSDKLQASGQQMQRMGGNITRTGKNIENVGKSMTTKLTVPILGAGVAAVKVASDFEAGLSRVSSISGATGDDLNKLSEMAKKMGATTKFSATEATEAYQYMAMAGWKTEDMLAGIEPIMKLAGASGEDLATTSDIVTDALTAFGKTANDTNELANVLANTAANANTNVAMMGESFKYVAPVAGSLNMSMQDTSVALGLMANSGIKASSAGTALRSILTRMSKPTKDSQAAMDALGVSLTDSQGNVKSLNDVMVDMRSSFAKLTDAQKSEYAASLAGKTGMSGLLAIVNSSPDDFNKLTDAVNDTTGGVNEMYDVANDNLQGQLTILKSTIESVAISFGEKLTPFVKQLTEKLQAAANWFNNLSDEQQKHIIKMAGVVAAIGPMLLGFGKITKTIGGVITSVGKLGAGMKRAKGFLGLLKMPSGIVVGALAAVAAIAFLVIKNWDRLKPAFKKIWNSIKPVVENLKKAFMGVGDKVGGLGAKISDAFVGIVNMIADVLPNIIDAVVPIIEELLPVFSDVFSMIGDAVKDLGKILVPIFKDIEKTVKALAPVVGQLLKTSFQALMNIIKAILPVIKKIVPLVGTVLKNAFKALGTVLKAVAPIIRTIVKIVGTVLTKVIQKLTPIIEKLGAMFAKIFNKISKVVTKVINKIQPVIEKLAPVFEKVMNKVSDAFSIAFDIVSGVIDTLIDTFEGLFDSVSTIFGGIIDFITGVFSGNWEQAWDGIVGIFKGIWDGIVAIAKTPINLLIDLINGLIGGLNKIKLPDWVPGIGGKGINIPLIPKLAKGTEAWRGGLVQISERGGEIVDLPRGSRVYPHDKSVQQAYKDGKASGGGGKVCINIPKLADQIVVRQDSDIDAIAQKLADKLEKVSLNVGGAEIGYQYQSI